MNDSVEKALRMVREAPVLSYDTETSGVDWRYNNPVGYVIGGCREGERLPADDVHYIPVRHGGGGNLLGGKALEKEDDEITPHPFEVGLAKAFEERSRNPKFITVGHNLKFDAHMSANAGVMLGRNLACTQGIEAILDEYSQGFSLSVCASKHGVTEKKGDPMYAHLAKMFGGKPDRSQMGNFWRLPGNDAMACEYATGDGVTTYELWVSQMRHIKEQNLEYITDIENRLIWTLFRMERRGIKVSKDEISRLKEAAEHRIRGLLENFPLGFNVRSPKMMKEFMDNEGLTDYPVTEKGNPSFTEKWLKRSDQGKNVIEIRRAANLINSFIAPLEERHIFKGRVHPGLNPLKIDSAGTVSGRFSCQNPNLQQVPKRVKEIAKPFRKVFAADEGFVFWERDYSQCEPRLFAHYSRDQALVDGYNSKPFRDAHSVVAEMLNVERDPTAKRMNMGIFTGMQTRTFADHMGWPLERATEAWHQWFSEFPGVKNFQDQARNVLKNRGYVLTILGRRCRLEHPRFAYRGASKVIQGSNADIVKLKLLEADQFCESVGDTVQVAMTVHDSFNGQYQDTPEAREAFEEMVRNMTEVQIEPYNLRVPFAMDGFEGRNWSEATFGAET